MTAVVVEVVDGLIGHQVAIVEEQSVEANAIRELELIVDVPVVLSIDAELVELHAGGRSGLAIVAIGEAEHLRSLIEELVDGHALFPVVAIVTRTVTHVLVVGHLVLEGDTTHDLVVAKIVGQVVLDVPNGVVHGVVPCEELIAEGHVVVVVAGDVDEGELRRVGAAHVVELRVGSQELVRQVVGQTAVQVERERVNEVVHGVHRVGKRHRVLRSTTTAHTRATIHRGSVRSIPEGVLRVVVAQGEVVLVGDVPVQASQELIVLLVGGEAGVAACVVTIFAGHVVAHGSEVAQLGARNVVVGIGNAILRTAPAVGNGRSIHHFAIDEEEELVLQDRAAEGETVGGLLVLGTCAADLLALDGVTTHVLVAVVDVGCAAEGVRTRLRDGIHTTTDEVGLANVVGRNHHLQFLDSIERDGVATTRKLVGETEVVVEVGTVDGEVSRTAVATGEAHAVTAIRRQTRHVGDRAAHGRQIGDLLAVDVGGSTRLLGSKLRSLTGDDDFAQFVGILRDPNAQVVGFTQLKHNAFESFGLETDVAHGNGIRATRTHTLDAESAIHVRHCSIAGARRFVHGLHGGTNDFLAISVADGHFSAHT